MRSTRYLGIGSAFLAVALAAALPAAGAPGPVKIEGVKVDGKCGGPVIAIVTVRNTGDKIGCRGGVYVSRGKTASNTSANLLGTADFTGINAGETKTFKIALKGTLDCCKGECFTVFLMWDPDCNVGQPWDHVARVVCVNPPAQPTFSESPLKLPR